MTLKNKSVKKISKKYPNKQIRKKISLKPLAPLMNGEDYEEVYLIVMSRDCKAKMPKPNVLDGISPSSYPRQWDSDRIFELVNKSKWRVKP